MGNMGVCEPEMVLQTDDRGLESLGEEIGNLILEEISEEKLDGGGGNASRRWEQHDADQEEEGEWSQCPQRSNENDGLKDDVDLKKLECDANLKELGEMDDNVGWEDDANLGKSEENSAGSGKCEMNEGTKGEGFGSDANLRNLEVKFEGSDSHEHTGEEEGNADLEKDLGSFKEEEDKFEEDGNHGNIAIGEEESKADLEKDEGLENTLRPDENTRWEGYTNFDKLEERFELDGYHKNTVQVKEDAPLKEERGEGFENTQRPNENVGWVESADLKKSAEKFEGDDVQENLGWGEDDADFEMDSSSFEEKWIGEEIENLQRHDNVWWVENADLEIPREKFEGDGVQENAVWEEDNAPIKEEKGGSFGHLQRPSENIGWDDDSNIWNSEEKFEGDGGYENTGLEYNSNHENTVWDYNASHENTEWKDGADMERGSASFKEWERGEWFKGYSHGNTEQEYYAVSANDSASFKDEEKGGWFKYPQRPSKLDCSYYVRTGNCSYGSNCKFNHPPDRKQNQATGETIKKLSRVGSTECKGKTERGPVELNFSGFPLRPGEKECSYYMRTGSCKFSTNCRFHHPDPTAIAAQDPISGYENGGSSEQLATGASQLPEISKALQKTSSEPVSLSNTSLWAMLLPPRRLHPPSDLNVYQAPESYSTSTMSDLTSHTNCYTHQKVQMEDYPEEPGQLECTYLHALMKDLPQRPGEPECSYFMKHGTCRYSSTCKFHHPSSSTLNGPTARADGLIHQQGQMEEYPERPGEPECSFFMEFGKCKFRSACKYHHPKHHLPRIPSRILSPIGLPLRPNQPICSYYSRFGICKFGPSCKFDHPMDYGFGSASSSEDI